MTAEERREFRGIVKKVTEMHAVLFKNGFAADIRMLKGYMPQIVQHLSDHHDTKMGRRFAITTAVAAFAVVAAFAGVWIAFRMFQLASAAVAGGS